MFYLRKPRPQGQRTHNDDSEIRDEEGDDIEEEGEQSTSILIPHEDNENQNDHENESDASDSMEIAQQSHHKQDINKEAKQPNGQKQRTTGEKTKRKPREDITKERKHHQNVMGRNDRPAGEGKGNQTKRG